MEGLVKAVAIAVLVALDIFVGRKLWKIMSTLQDNWSGVEPEDKEGFPARFYSPERNQSPPFSMESIGRWFSLLFSLALDVLFFRQPGTFAGECNSQKKSDPVKKRWNLFTLRGDRRRLYRNTIPSIFWFSLLALYGFMFVSYFRLILFCANSVFRLVIEFVVNRILH